AWRSWNPSCTGSSLPSTSSDSTVLISWPSHMTARIVQDFTGAPSISTTHAPQLEVSHPQCVPVSPGVSRMKWTSSRRGSMSRVTCSPLMVIETFMSGLLVERARRGAPEGTGGEDAREVALVVDGAAPVRQRRAVGGRDVSGLGEQFVRRRLAAQQLLGPRDLDS